MDLNSIFAISGAGMEVEQARFNAAALNMANAHSTRASDGSLYQPLRVISRAGGNMDFGQVFQGFDAQAFAPRIQQYVPTSDAPRMMYDPGHPSANEAGYVETPAINSTLEMLSLITALRAYEANVVALNAAKSMAMKSMEIGGNT